MARRNESNEPNKLDWRDIKYVINNLPPKDLKIVDATPVTLDDVNNFMTEQSEVGGHFKFVYDYNYGKCANASLVYYYDGYPNSGYAISARGEDFSHCMSILMYKFHEVAKTELFKLTEVARANRYG